MGVDETLSLFDPNTFPLKPGLHVVQIHCHLIQHSRLHAEPLPLPLQGKDENIQLLAGEVGVRACDNQPGCLDLIRPLAGCPSISRAPPSQSLCPRRQEDKGSCPSPGRAEKGPWGHQLFLSTSGHLETGNGHAQKACVQACPGHATHRPVCILKLKKILVFPPLLSLPLPPSLLSPFHLLFSPLFSFLSL